MLAPVQLEHQRRHASGAHQKQGHAEIGAIHNMRCDHVAQRSHRLRPRGIQSPVRELFDILDQHYLRPVELGGRHHCPGCRAG
ncbi:hypothetical protein D3C85_1138740 [compost metagenome]